MIAYELLSGALPFRRRALPQMMEQHFRATGAGAVDPRQGHEPPTLDRVLARALAKDPDARFATAHELVDALRDAAGGKAMPRAGRARNPMVAPAVAGVGVLGLAIVGFVVVHGGGSGDTAQAGGGPLVSPDGFVRIQVITQPAQATVSRNDQLVGGSPATFEVRPGTAVSVQIRSPPR